MLVKLAKIANRLDGLGLTKEADILDNFIKKIASEGDDDFEWDDYQDSVQREYDYNSLWDRQNELQEIEESPVSEEEMIGPVLENLRKRVSDSVEILSMKWDDYKESITTGLYCWRVRYQYIEPSGNIVSKEVPVARVTSDFDDDSILIAGQNGEDYYFFAFI
jgi:hypothetical protein